MHELKFLFLILINTVNSDFFARILFSRTAFKHIFATLKIAARAYLLISVNDRTDFVNSGCFYFHETSHMRSFEKIKPSRKFSNLQYMYL